MKYLIFISLLFLSCKRKPDLWINGNPYKIDKYCIESHEEPLMYDDGYGNIITMFSTECDKYKIDTIPFK